MYLNKYFVHSVFISAVLLGAGQPCAYGQNKGKTVVKDSVVRLASGVVLDAATKKPLVGMNISVPSFSAAITDEKGRFSIKVPGYDATLQIKGEGFQNRQVPLRGKKEVTVSLYDESVDSYYDYAVTATGSRSKSQLTGPVIVLDTRGAWDRNVETPDNYLQGIANGLSVIRKSGEPGSGATLFGRGINSLYTTNKPLVVVDGMIYDTDDFGGSLISGHTNNPFSLLDMQDVDNITYIKDGSSTYGTKGANGVLLISTIRAKQLATKMEVGVYTGVNFAPKSLPVMNASQFRTYLTDMLQSKGLSAQQIQAQPYMTDDVNSSQYARYHHDTRWQDAVLKNSITRNAYLKIMGGDNIARYALSMGYAKNEGVVDKTDFTRMNTRFNADLNLTARLTASANLAFAYSQQKQQNQGLAPKVNPVYVALVKAPFMAQNEISDKGDISPNMADVDTLGISNPSALINNLKATNRSYRFSGSLQFNYAINKAWSVSTLFGITNDKVRENFFVPSKGVVHDTLQAAIARNRSGSQAKRLFAIYSDTWVRFKKTYARIHDVEAVAGVRFQQQQEEQDWALGFNSATDELVNVGYGVAALRQVGGDLGKNRWLNNYLNVSYGYDGKLFFNAGLAIDGSSRFGTQIPGALGFNGSKYAVLPNVGAAWLISSERFMSSMPVISFARIRATYTFSGNDDIGDYTARQYYVSQNLLGMQGLVRGNIPNPRLQWEVNKKASVGVDAGLLNDAIQVSVDVYHNTTDKMLVKEQAPAASGIDYMYANTGAMKTTGIEAGVNALLINKPGLRWEAGFTLSRYKNTVTALPAGRILTPYAGGTVITETGSAANLFYGYKTNGVYSTDAAAAADGYTTQLVDAGMGTFRGGDVRFVDKDGNKQVNESDRQVIGNPNPDFTGTFNTGLTWKRFSLNALFTFSKGNDIYNYTRAMLESQSGYQNQLTSVVNRWRTQGQVTNMPRATWGDPLGNGRFSDRWIEDGSYLRLRTVSLSYNVKVKPGFVKYITVYALANNLFTITKYLGYDPEFSSTESPLGQGVEVGLAPLYKSTQLGVRIGL